MKSRLPLFLIFILIILIAMGTRFFSSNQKTAFPVENKLHKAMVDPLSGAKGKYSVVVKDLVFEKTESLYGDKIFEMGSLYKLWIMAEVFNQIKEGKLSEDEILSEDISVLNDDFRIDSDDAELTEGKITLSVKSALNQMITISHNYAAMLLTKKIKVSNVSIFLKNNGFRNSHVGNGEPTSTADDIALFFEKLYKGELNNPKYSKEMIDLLKAQQLNNKLPKYLPKNIAIAHKTGEINYLSHDTGIVYTKNGNYIIVVLSETNSPPGANERIAQISKSVFNYVLSREVGDKNNKH